MLPRLPVLRAGLPYASAEQLTVHGCDGRPAVVLDYANAGLIRKELRAAEAAAPALAALPTRRWLELCAAAGEHFLSGTLPLGDETQTPAQAVAATSSTTGLPYAACREHLAKLHRVLTSMETVLNGLTGGIPPDQLDTGRDGAQRLARTARSLGVVLPSNAPGTNGVWLPALALKLPVLLKPGRHDPWTPYRLVQALLAAGCPRTALGFYPTDHGGADILLRATGAAQVFGGPDISRRFDPVPRVEVHGPGRSKILFGPDLAAAWEDFLPVLLRSIDANAGRSCINTSTVLVPGAAAAEAVAEALAAALGGLEALPLEHPEAGLAAFPDPRVAQGIDARLEAAIETGEVRDLAAAHRDGPRLVEVQGRTYLRPAVLRVDRGHAFADTELPFICVAVVEVPPEQLVAAAADSLIVTALTRDAKLLTALAGCPGIGRLHAGPRPTTQLDWSQPQEGNLFELVSSRRALTDAWATA